MKKLAFVTPWFDEKIPGGAEMELRGLTKHLYDSGVELEILTTCVKEFSSDWNVNYFNEGLYDVLGMPVRRFEVSQKLSERFHQVNYKFMNNLPVTLEEEDVYLKEMVNSQNLYNYMENHIDDYALFIFIPYMFGTTYNSMKICPEKSVLIPCLHDESYAYMERFKELFKNIAGMIFHAEPEKVLADKLYDLSEVNAVVLGEGLDTKIEGERARFIEKYKIDSPFVLYAGRKDSGKNVDTLIKYFDMYKKRQDNKLKLILIGGGQIEIPSSAQNDIIDLGFVPVQDKYDAYAAAELLCQPSHNESFSLVIMESWLCGRPVLVHNKCEVTKHFAITSKGGLYFDNYFEFEGCLNYITGNQKIAQQMGNNGKQFVLNNFTWAVIVERYMKYFEDVCKANEERGGIVEKSYD